jgi:7-keto-8-aminopelargonate synthetase-like enzyme
VEQSGLTGQVEIQMGTLGKAVGAAGGFICGSRELIDFLINSARSFIFSTAPVPAAAAAAKAGIELIQGEEGRQRCEQVWHNANAAAAMLSGTSNPGSPIVPVHIGDEAEAVRVSNALRENGFLVPAIRYPTVARGAARLRVTLSADHKPEQINSLATALEKIIDRNS